MRQFLSSLLGTLAGLALFTVGGAILLLVILGAVGAAVGAKKSVRVENGSYLVFNMNVNVTDAPPVWGGGLSSLMGGDQGPKTLQLRQVVNTLKAAAKDSRIKGLYLEGNLSPEGYGTGMAALKELRDAVSEFRASGKPVLAYLNFAMLRDVYLASAADQVIMDPFGMVVFPGLASEPTFMAGAFEKFGVGVQVTRVGKFKSAVEPYTRKDMSPASREQLQELLDSLWLEIRSDIASTTKAKVDGLQALADARGMIRGDEALAAHLVTRLGYRDEVIQELKKRTEQPTTATDFKQVDLAVYQKSLSDPNSAPVGPLGMPSGPRIAVVYAEGAIVEGPGGEGEVGGERYAEAIAKLRQDDDVKAIVLRVNSPGGSVGASEHIQRELRLAKKTKPLIISMGTYAASGGYWISAYGDHIFAQKTTITGSIGVFGIQFNIEKLAGNLGFTFDRVKTAERGDLLSISRPKTEAELAVFQQNIDWIYDQFLVKVAEGRSLKKEKVDDIAQGRVWAGSTAVKLGLVDEIGGLNDAIAYAAKKAGLSASAAIEEFPRRRTFNEVFATWMQQMGENESKAPTLSSKVSRQVQVELHKLDEYNDSKGLYARLPFELSTP